MFQLKNQIVLLIIGTVIGLLVVSQYQAKPLTITTERFEEINDQKEIVETLSKEQNYLKTQISVLREKLNEIQAKSIKKEDSQELDKLKELVGLSPVIGPGIKITFKDSPDTIRENLDVNNDALVHAADLRDIINLLRVSQVEAISINGQRVLISSPISCVGNSILVNNTNLLPPFQIEAIGDADVLLTHLSTNLKNTLPSIYKRKIENNLIFNIERKEHIVIPIYTGDLSLKYTEKGE